MVQVTATVVHEGIVLRVMQNTMWVASHYDILVELCNDIMYRTVRNQPFMQ
jgi:hypothetical protein